METYIVTVEQVLSGHSLRVLYLIANPTFNIKVLVDEKVRLIGIDCLPEKGLDCKRFLESELLGKEVTLKTPGGRDKANRLLGLIIKEKTNINSLMVEKNLAYRL